MITVLVSYTVNADFAERNKENIAVFLNDFKQIKTSGFRYDVSVKADGLTFVHYSCYLTPAIQEAVLNVPSFKAFQKERDESGLEDTHKVEVLNFLGASDVTNSVFTRINEND